MENRTENFLDRKGFADVNQVAVVANVFTRTFPTGQDDRQFRTEKAQLTDGAETIHDRHRTVGDE